MRSESECAEEEIEDVPVSPLLYERKNRYGSVPGLDDEELARELERQVMLQEWGPVLMLPVRGKNGGFRPELDEEGIDWGAFGTVDFARTMPKFDKARYTADMLQEKWRDVLITLSIVKERIPIAAYRVLQYLHKGVIVEEHIASKDIVRLASR